MKRLMMVLMAFCLVIPIAYPENKDTQLEKALRKEYKEKKKKLKKEGWKIFGSSQSLDDALLAHYDKLQTSSENNREIVGVASNAKSKNVGHQMAITNACITFAQQTESQIKGHIKSVLAADGSDTAAELERYYANYERFAEKEIRGEMDESFSIYRDMSGGTYEFQTFFIINEKIASEVCIRAMENAFDEIIQ